MPRIHVSYGPPGQSGVSTIMGLGADEVASLADKRDKMLMQAGFAGVGLWLVGTVIGAKRVRDMGAGGALAAFLVRHLSK